MRAAFRYLSVQMIFDFLRNYDIYHSIIHLAYHRHF